MIQKRLNGHQQQHHPPKVSSTINPNQGQRFRYLSEMPDFSAVIQRQTTKNMYASESEVSLLEKIAAHNNDKICDSSLFQDQKENGMDTKMVQEMKFSFSNNDPIEIDHKQSRLSGQFSKIQLQSSKSKGTFMRLDNESLQMKRRKDLIKEEIMNQSIQTIKNKYIFNHKKIEKTSQNEDPAGKSFGNPKLFSQTGSMENVFNKVLIDVKKDSSRDKILPITKQSLPTINQQPIILNTNNSLDKLIPSTTPASQTTNPHYLSVLFQLLDRSKTGKIDRYNCNILAITEELQLIFGIIFYRIKFNSEGFTKKEFVQMSLQCMRLLGPQTPSHLFKDLDPHQEAHHLMRDQTGHYKSQSKFEQKGVSLYHLLDSPPKDKVTLSRTQKQASISLNKSPYVNLKETRYENVGKIQEKTVTDQRIVGMKQDKYAGKYMKKSNYNPISVADSAKGNDEKKYETVKADIGGGNIPQSSRYTFRDKQNPISTYLTSTHILPTAIQAQQKSIPKKKRNISEEILMEHKKNLEELQKLNEKMENYINHKPESQHAHAKNHQQGLQKYATLPK